MASITQRFLVPVSTVSTRNAWHNDPPFVYKIRRTTPDGYFQENWVGVSFTLPETLTLFQTKICDFCYPISDLIKNMIPYFRPEDLEPVAWQERETSCYGTYTVGVNIKREMVLSPNDEEIASSKKHTQLKRRVHKPYLISDQNGRNWYHISDQNHTFWRRTYLYNLYTGVRPPRGAKNALQIMSLAAYASETNEVNLSLTFTQRLGYSVHNCNSRNAGAVRLEREIISINTSAFCATL